MRCNPGHSHRHIYHHHHHHSHCGPCFGGSVFTVSHHCGGHSAGFWGGFGAGLGMGLGNMLGGFMNSFTSGFGNMFGGFGNMFGGFGMGGFGFGMPMMGGFGMGGFGMPWAASYGGGTVKDDAYFASKYGTGISSSTSSSSSVKSEEDDEASDKGSVSGDTGGTGNTDGTGNPDKVTIAGKEVDINGITINELKKMTDDELEKIDKTKAEEILKEIGFLDDGVGKMSTEYVVLKLLEKSEIEVECANNSNAEDQWIKGKITNVAKPNENTKLSYTIDCEGVSDAKFEYKYIFEQIDNETFKVTTVNKNGSSKQGYLIKDEKENRVYVYDKNNQYLVKKVPEIYLISSKSSSDRNEVE